MNIVDPPSPDPLFPHRILERAVEPALHDRICAILAPYANKLHLPEMRMELQEKLRQELGINVVIQGSVDPRPERTIPGMVDIHDYSVSNQNAQDLKKSTIPIPGYRRKRWE